MEKILIPVCVCAAAAAFADVAVDDYATLDVAVSNDTVQAEGVWTSLEAGKIEKGGPAAWTLSTANLATRRDAVVAVREGELRVAAGTPAAPEAPTDVLSKALLWFDATKADTLEEGTSALDTGVATWYDAREQKGEDGTWGTAYYRAVARTSWVTATDADGAETVAVQHPVKKAYDGMPGVAYVDFNGRQSGSWMGFQTPGTRANVTANIEQIRHVFYSGYVVEAWGFPMGSFNSPVWHPVNTAGTLSGYASPNSSHPALFMGRATMNGAVHEENRAVETGPYVYTWDAGDRTAWLANFFNDRNLFSTYKRAGGDSLGEVVVFTNALTVLERERVAQYLLRKWRPASSLPTAGTIDVRTAKGTSVAVQKDAPATVTGAGTVRVVEDGTVLPFSRKADFTGQVRLDAATATLTTVEPELALAAGDVLAATRDNFENLAFTKSTDAAKAASGEAALTLPANGRARLSALPGTVKKVSVSGAGELILGAPRPGTGIRAAGEVYATMPNADMEEWASGGNSASGFGTAGRTYYHWKLVSTTTQNYFLNMSVLPSVGHWTLDGGNKKNFRWADYPCQGKNVMLLKQGCVVENTVAFPEDGDYELTFLSFARMDGSNPDQYAGGWVKMSLVDGPGDDVEIGTAFAYIGSSTQHQRFIVRGVKKGAYTFRLNHAVGSGDAHTALDDFKFRLVTDVPSETVVYPPNADFERVDMVWAGRVLRNVGNTLADWTLEQGSTDPDVCVVTRGIRNAGYRRGSTRGGVQLAFFGNGGRATSKEFTLPAGTWKLRLRKAAFANTESDEYKVNGKQCNQGSGVTGELLDGDTVLSFGSLGSSLRCRMERCTLPTAITLDEPRTVRLRLRESVASGSTLPTAYVDELELVRQDPDGELLRNGTFADSSVWTRKTNKNTETEANAANTTKSQSNIWDPCRMASGAYAYGNTYGVNKLALDICQCGSADQEVAFPAAGTYRLAFSARSRYWLNSNGSVNRTWSGNQARFYLVDADANTNEIYRTPSLYSTNFVFRSALFTVPAAGTYTFGIQGVNGMTLPDGTLANVGWTASDVELFIDQVSVRAADDAALNLDEKVELVLKDTAKLRLDFAGTNEVAILKLGGKTVTGFIDATHPSGLVLGAGCLYVRPRGTVITLR